MDKVLSDWRNAVALSAAFVLSVFALKMRPDDAKEAVNHLVDAAKETLIAIFGE